MVAGSEIMFAVVVIGGFENQNGGDWDGFSFLEKVATLAIGSFHQGRYRISDLKSENFSSGKYFHETDVFGFLKLLEKREICVFPSANRRPTTLFSYVHPMCFKYEIVDVIFYIFCYVSQIQIVHIILRRKACLRKNKYLLFLKEWPQKCTQTWTLSYRVNSFPWPLSFVCALGMSNTYRSRRFSMANILHFRLSMFRPIDCRLPQSLLRDTGDRFSLSSLLMH